VECACCLARCGADAASEFRKVVGRLENFQRVLPVVLVNQMVPVRDDVVHRAAIMAVGNAAIHAAGCLLAQTFLAQRNDEFLVVLHPLRGILIGPVLPVDFEKAGFLAHCLYLYSAATEAASSCSASSCCSARR